MSDSASLLVKYLPIPFHVQRRPSGMGTSSNVVCRPGRHLNDELSWQETEIPVNAIQLGQTGRDGDAPTYETGQDKTG